MLEPTGMAQHTVHFNGLASKFAAGDSLDATYTWNFGDPGSRFNTLTGWIGAHTYDTAGTYTVSLTVTDKAGNSSTVTSKVTIAPDTRRQIYVDSVGGDDANTGGSPEFAVASIGRAMQLLGNDTELLFHNGQSFNVVNSLFINYSNVVIGSYGSGSQARIAKVKGSGSSIFNIGANTKNVLAQNITLDSMWDMATYGTGKVNVYGFYVSGNNFTVRNCTFLNVDDGVNTAGSPTGVLVQDNYFATTIRGCCIWGQGYDHVYIGNTMTDSTKEHLIRCSANGVTRLLIEDNNMSRISPTKGSLELRVASFFYVSGNIVHGGTLRVGLPDGPDAYYTGWGVVQGNQFYNLFGNFRPGAEHVELRDNVFNEPVGTAINLETTGSADNRSITDIRIEQNTLLDTSDYSKFLKVDGDVTEITVTNNLMIDPNLKWLGDATGAIYVQASNLNGFAEISNNIWPQMPSNSAQAGDSYLYPQWGVIPTGFISNADWNKLPQVNNDQYKNPTLQPKIYDITLNGVTAGAMPTLLNPANWGQAVGPLPAWQKAA